MTDIGPKSKILLASARGLLVDLPENLVMPVLDRLRKGADTYGDSSFDKASPEIVAEIECEFLDIIGWWLVLAGVDRDAAMALHRAGLMEAVVAGFSVIGGLKVGMYGGNE